MSFEIKPTPSIDVSASVNAAIDDLVAAAPAALDTLNELAAALNDDANFAATVTNQIANKLDKTTPTLNLLGSLLVAPMAANYGDVYYSTGDSVYKMWDGDSWNVVSSSFIQDAAGPTHKEVFYLGAGYGEDRWSADGITWVEPSSTNVSSSGFDQWQKIASSGSRTVIVNNNSNIVNNTDTVLEVREDFWNQTSNIVVSSKTGSQINAEYPGIENAIIGSISPMMKGVASDGNGTFVITFTRSTKFLVSTDNGSTWATVEIPAPPSGEGEGGGEGGQSPYWNAPTYQFGKFYVTAFGYNGFVQSSDGLNWTVVPVSGMAYSGYNRVYVDASGSILAAYDQAMGLVYMSTSNNQGYYGTAYNSSLMNADNHSLRVVGGSLYFYYAGSVRSASIKYLNNAARTVYTSTELGAQSYNFVTATKDAVLYGAYNFATNNHKMGQIGKRGASWPVGTGLHGQSDMFGHAGSLMIPVEVYNKYVGE